MKKMIKVALAVMLVLIAVTACQPQYVLYDPDMLPGHGGTKYTEAKDPADFEKLIKEGTPVIVPAPETGEKYVLPSDLDKPVNIKGEEEGALIYIEAPATGTENSGYNFPAGSKLENIDVVFSAPSTQSLGRAADPEPQFAMVISGNGTTISGVDFIFPDVDESLSGICIWNAKNVSISDVTFTGVPARAPFNISGSTVKFSGNIEAKNGSGWYEGEGVTVIQINGVGSNHEKSNVTFSKVTGVDAVWQEVLETSYNADDTIDWKNPSGSSVSGLSGFYRIYSDRPTSEDAEGTRGWMWMSSEYSKKMIPAFFAAPAHDRFFNALNEDLKTTNPAYGKMTDIERPALSNSMTYKFNLNEFDYSSMSPVMKALATGNNLSVTFSGKTEGDSSVTVDKWSMTGDVDLELVVPETITAKISFSMKNFSGIFSDKIQGTEPRTAKFIEQNGAAWIDIEKKNETPDNNPAFTLATGLTGSLSINGVAADLDEFMDAAKNFSADDLKELLGQ